MLEIIYRGPEKANAFVISHFNFPPDEIFSDPQLYSNLTFSTILANLCTILLSLGMHDVFQFQVFSTQKYGLLKSFPEARSQTHGMNCVPGNC